MPVPTKHEIEIIPATDMPTIVYVSAPPDLLSVGVGGRMEGIDGIDGIGGIVPNPPLAGSRGGGGGGGEGEGGGGGGGGTSLSMTSANAYGPSTVTSPGAISTVGLPTARSLAGWSECALNEWQFLPIPPPRSTEFPANVQL